MTEINLALLSVGLFCNCVFDNKQINYYYLFSLLHARSSHHSLWSGGGGREGLGAQLTSNRTLTYYKSRRHPSPLLLFPRSSPPTHQLPVVALQLTSSLPSLYRQLLYAPHRFLAFRLLILLLILIYISILHRRYNSYLITL